MEDKKPGEPGSGKSDRGKDAPRGGSADGSKAKDAKQTPAPERKKPSKLSEDKRFKLFSGTANPRLAEEVARHIGVTVGQVKLQRFADGEVYFQLLEERARRRCVCGAAHLLSGGSASGGIAHYDRCAQEGLGGPHHGSGSLLRVRPSGSQGSPARGHQRQADCRSADHRRRRNRALFVDLHAAQIQGFFNIPVDHIFASPVLVSHFKRTEPSQPDGGFAGCGGRRGAHAILRAENGRAACDCR